MKKQFSLNKQERLKSRKQIALLFAEGKRLWVAPLRVYYAISSDAAGISASASALQVGVGVSSKRFKKAVDRNRIKRLIKEAWRLQKNECANALLDQYKKMNVFLIYTGKELPTFSFIQTTVSHLLQQLSQQI
jgi:ribonuclease P protein component